MSASSFTAQPLYYPACSAGLSDVHVCAFSINTFSFYAWLQREPWGNRLKGRACTGRKQSHNMPGKVKVGGVDGFQYNYLWKYVWGKSYIRNYFHVNCFCKWSHWIYTVWCITELHPIKSHSVIMKGIISGFWRVKHLQGCAVFWQSLVWCVQRNVLEILEAGMKEHGLITAQMCLSRQRLLMPPCIDI